MNKDASYNFHLAPHIWIEAILLPTWWVPGLLEPAEEATMGESVYISIRHAITGEFQWEWTRSKVGMVVVLLSLPR